MAESGCLFCATHEPCAPNAVTTAAAQRCTTTNSDVNNPVGSSGSVTMWARGTTST